MAIYIGLCVAIAVFIILIVIIILLSETTGTHEAENNENMAIYIGLCVAIAVFIILIVIIILIVKRRKRQLPNNRNNIPNGGKWPWHYLEITAWVKVFRIIPEFRILRLTYILIYLNAESYRQIIKASGIYCQFILGLEIINDV